MNSRNLAHFLLGLLSLTGLLAANITPAKAAQLVQPAPIQKVPKRTFQAKSQRGAIYQLINTNKGTHLKLRHHLVNYPHTNWTSSKKRYLTKNGQRFTYYYVVNKHGKHGWVWGKYLKTTAIHLKVPMVGQRPQLPTGCEITATTMMLKYQGSKVSKIQLAHEMPRSSDPNRGFVGSPFRSAGALLCVYPGGLMSTVKRHAGSAINLTGASLSRIKLQLVRNRPVVAWVSRLDGFRTHSITLTGYTAKRIYFNDPWTRTRTSLSNHEFKTDWRLDRYRALSY